MRQLIPTAAMCLLLAGFAVAGCGGGGDKGGSTRAGGEGAAKAETGEGEAPGTGESSSGGAAPSEKSTPESKAEFVAKANALCTKRRQQMQVQLRKIFKGGNEGSQQAALHRLIEGVVAPGMQAEADELRALGAPPGDGAKVEAIVAAIDALVAEAREDPKAFLAAANAFGKAEQAARAYGIGACGRVS